MTYKPGGYTGAAPYLIVRDAKRTRTFVRAKDAGGTEVQPLKRRRR